jgi:hypothetical protein
VLVKDVETNIRRAPLGLSRLARSQMVFQEGDVSRRLADLLVDSRFA